MLELENHHVVGGECWPPWGLSGYVVTIRWSLYLILSDERVLLPDLRRQVVPMNGGLAQRCVKRTGSGGTTKSCCRSVRRQNLSECDQSGGYRQARQCGGKSRGHLRQPAWNRQHACPFRAKCGISVGAATVHEVISVLSMRRSEEVHYLSVIFSVSVYRSSPSHLPVALETVWVPESVSSSPRMLPVTLMLVNRLGGPPVS